jgi:hypothetical protein
MGYGNAHKYRPEIQARKAMYAASPEHCRRKEMYRKASGLKKKKVAHWNHTWALAGYPDAFPDFDAFWASHPAAMQWIADRKSMQSMQREINKKHAAWVAAGMPYESTDR